MFCKKCGKEFQGSFCPSCGEKAENISEGSTAAVIKQYQVQHDAIKIRAKNMSRIAVILAAVAIAAFGLWGAKDYIFGNSSNNYIKMIQTAKKDEYGNITYQDALESCYKSPSWRYFETDNMEKIVEFTGNEASERVCIQFTLDIPDERFQVNYMEFAGDSYNINEMAGYIEDTFENYLYTN